MFRSACVTGVLAAVVAVSPAGAASPFTPPVTLSPPGSAMGEARMNARGDVAILWQGSRNLNADRSQGHVEGVLAPAGTTFGPLQRLDSGDVAEPRLGLSEDGRIAALWNRWGRGLATASGSVTGGFGPAQSLAAHEGLNTAVGPGGEAVSAWTGQDPDGRRVSVLGAYRPPGGSFGPAHVLWDRGPVQEPAVAVDGTGAAVVVWQAPGEAGGPWRVWTATLSPSGAPSPAVAISSAAEDVRNGGLKLAVNGRGDIAVAWAGAAGPPPGGGGPGVPFMAAAAPRVAVRPSGGAFGAPEALGAPAYMPPVPQVALDHHGNAVTAWIGSGGGAGNQPAINVARRPAGGTFGPPRHIAANRVHGQFVRVGLDGRGNAVVAWAEAREGTIFDLILFAAWIRSDGRVGLPTTLMEAANPDALVFDAGTRGLLIARRIPGESVVAFGYDGHRLDVPAAAPLARLSVDPRRGARFLVTEPGHVVARLERAVRGRCRGCTAYRRVFERQAKVSRGVRVLRLTGPRGRRLAPATYRLSLRAHDLGGRRLAERRVRFRAARR